MGRNLSPFMGVCCASQPTVSTALREMDANHRDRIKISLSNASSFFFLLRRGAQHAGEARAHMSACLCHSFSAHPQRLSTCERQNICTLPSSQRCHLSNQASFPIWHSHRRQGRDRVPNGETYLTYQLSKASQAVLGPWSCNRKGTCSS